MSDILIRNVDPALKGALKARARANERSLSDEVKALVRRGLETQGTPSSQEGIGTQLSKLIPPELWTGEFLMEHDLPADDPPDFS